MGAWGTGIYENDDAADWDGELAARGLAAIRDAIDAVLDSEFIDACEGSYALVAADVVARLRSGVGATSAYSEGVETWVAANPSTPPDELVERALRALTAVKSEDSELWELWSEDPEVFADWMAAIQDVSNRLSS